MFVAELDKYSEILCRYCVDIVSILVDTRRYSSILVDTRRYSLILVDTRWYWRSRPFIYTSRGRTGKFEFVYAWRLHVAATLFCPEFICSYITCNLTILVLQGKTTTRFELSYDSCAATVLNVYPELGIFDRMGNC